jgi:predicted carbohydrate-binding protein with CBM5 and CBM33 domain
MDNPEKLATQGTQDKDNQTLENTEGTIKDGQYRETGNTGYTRQRQINVREYRRDNQRWAVQRNWQHRVHKTKTNKQNHNTICVRHHYTRTNTNNVNKTQVLLQTTGGKDEPFMRTSFSQIIYRTIKITVILND